MQSSAVETGALCETVVFLGYFKDLPDARQSGKVKYALDEILLLCLLAVVAGAEAITDIAKFGRLKLALLRRFRPFADGTPAHDHLGDILATLDAETFGRCFVAWVAAQTGVSEVHDLHVWEVTTGFPSISAHIVVDAGHDCHEVRRGLSRLLADEFDLPHSTLQVEHARAAQPPISIEIVAP